MQEVAKPLSRAVIVIAPVFVRYKPSSLLVWWYFSVYKGAPLVWAAKPAACGHPRTLHAGEVPRAQ